MLISESESTLKTILNLISRYYFMLHFENTSEKYFYPITTNHIITIIMVVMPQAFLSKIKSNVSNTRHIVYGL